MNIDEVYDALHAAKVVGCEKDLSLMMSKSEKHVSDLRTKNRPVSLESKTRLFHRLDDLQKTIEKEIKSGEPIKEGRFAAAATIHRVRKMLESEIRWDCLGDI